MYGPYSKPLTSGEGTPSRPLPSPLLLMVKSVYTGFESHDGPMIIRYGLLSPFNK